MTASPKTKRAIKVGVGLLAAISCVAVASWFLLHWPQTARRHWKDDAIPSVASLAENKNWRAQEIAILTNRMTDRRVLAEAWLTDKLILMQSGEWLVYKSHCSKERPHLVKDIFLAKGSDDNWY